MFTIQHKRGPVVDTKPWHNEDCIGDYGGTEPMTHWEEMLILVARLGEQEDE